MALKSRQIYHSKPSRGPSKFHIIPHQNCHLGFAPKTFIIDFYFAQIGRTVDFTNLIFRSNPLGQHLFLLVPRWSIYFWQHLFSFATPILIGNIKFESFPATPIFIGSTMIHIFPFKRTPFPTFFFVCGRCIAYNCLAPFVARWGTPSGTNFYFYFQEYLL